MKKFNKEKDLVDYFRKQVNKTQTYVMYSFENSTSDIVNGWPDQLLMNRVTKNLVWLEFKVNHKVTPNQRYIRRVFETNDYKLITINLDNYKEWLTKIKNKDLQITKWD